MKLQDVITSNKHLNTSNMDTKKLLLNESAFSIINKYKTLGDKSLYRPILSYLGQQPFPRKLASLWLSQLRDCVPLLDKSTEPIIIDTISIPWEFEDEAIQTHVHNFVISLVTGHNYFVSPIFQCLFRKMEPVIRPEEEEHLRQEPFSLSDQHVSANSKIIQLIFSIVDHVPLSRSVLLKTMQKSTPYFKRHVHIHAVFIYNILTVSRQMPDLRREIMEIIVMTIVKLDVHTPRVELEDESDSESDAGSEVFDMEVDTVQSNAPAMSHPLGHILDVLMTLFFRYIHFVAHGGSDLRQILQNSTKFEVNGCLAGSATFKNETDSTLSTFKNGEKNDGTNGCSCNGTKHNIENLKTLYLDLKTVFSKIILPTHASSHAQFIIYYILAIRPSLISDFLDFLKNVFESPTRSLNEDRKSATAYLSSLLARGKFVKFTHVHYCLEVLTNWCKNYLSSEFVRANNYEDMNLHFTFYYACQTIFYVFTFNYTRYTQSKARLKLAQSLRMDELIVSGLNPLRCCSQAIVANFAAITRHFQLAYCYAIMESNRRLTIPLHSQETVGSSTVLETYFPFDPYLLKRSNMFIREHYAEFEGLPQEILNDVPREVPVTGETAVVDKGDIEDSIFWNSPQSFEMSPGFQSFH